MDDFKELPLGTAGALYKPTPAETALCFHIFEGIVRPDAPTGFVAQTIVRIAMEVEGYAVAECDAASKCALMFGDTQYSQSATP
jgi:hypothetical protein